MTDETNTPNRKESKLVATVISHNEEITLITPEVRYQLYKGRLTKAPENVNDYNKTVQEEIGKITQRAQTPIIGILEKEEYVIEIYGGSASKINLA